MGDISGRPKTPSQEVVYVPQYIYTDSGSGSGSGSGSDSGGGSDDGTKTPSASEQREQNLLNRSRSSLGTILTGFRGILAPKETDSQRKTLLGE